MLYGVKSSVCFSHVHWDYGHPHLTCTICSGKETTPWTTTTAFPLHLTFFLIILPLFVFFIRYCCSCYELRCFLKKIDQMWSDYLFSIFSRILVQMNANKFYENSWETLRFSGQVNRIQAILKPNTTSKGRTTTADRERRRNRMNTLGDDKTRSRSTFRFFKKIAPTEFKEFKV